MFKTTLTWTSVSRTISLEHQMSSNVIKCHQMSSNVIKCHQSHQMSSNIKWHLTYLDHPLSSNIKWHLTVCTPLKGVHTLNPRISRKTATYVAKANTFGIVACSTEGCPTFQLWYNILRMGEYIFSVSLGTYNREWLRILVSISRGRVGNGGGWGGRDCENLINGFA